MVKFYSCIEDEKLKFAVIFAKSDGKFVLCKHKMRDTLEFPGGHREPNEFIVDTAKRELKEETGAKDFTFEPFDSEIEKIVITDTLTQNWTYPTIQPYLLKELERRNLL